MIRTLELSEAIYDRLLEAARAGGVSPTDWIARRLPANGPAPVVTDEERSAALERLLRHAGSIRTGRPTGLDNEQIDADLTREYGDTHEETP